MIFNVMEQDGVKIIGKTVYVNGKEMPSCPSKSKNINSTVINGHVYINGYELVDNAWRRTLKALWHYWF